MEQRYKKYYYAKSFWVFFSYLFTTFCAPLMIVFTTLSAHNEPMMQQVVATKAKTKRGRVEAKIET